jgi:hypothetical protein
LIEHLPYARESAFGSGGRTAQVNRPAPWRTAPNTADRITHDGASDRYRFGLREVPGPLARRLIALLGDCARARLEETGDRLRH